MYIGPTYNTTYVRRTHKKYIAPSNILPYAQKNVVVSLLNRYKIYLNCTLSNLDTHFAYIVYLWCSRRVYWFRTNVHKDQGLPQHILYSGLNFIQQQQIKIQYKVKFFSNCTHVHICVCSNVHKWLTKYYYIDF